VSAEASVELVGSDGLRESLAQICASHEEFQRFFSGVFTELDVLSAELIRRQRAWQSERTQAEGDLREQAARLEAQRAMIATERDQAWKEVERRRSEVEQELAQARADLAEARREIERLRNGLQSVSTEAAQPQADPKLEQQLQQMAKEHAKLDQERLVLETELDTVRNRAAEMAETLAEQRRQMAAEREQWTQELRRMRRVLEAISAKQVEHRADLGSRREFVELQETAAACPRSAAADGDGDPVLGSVMAQFEMLQKDITRRRKDNADGD